MDPTQSKVLFHIGYTYEKQGFYEEARSYYRDYLKLTPESEGVREHLNLVEAKMKQGEKESPNFRGPGSLPLGQLGFESQLPFDRFGGLFGTTANELLTGGQALFQSGAAILSQLLRSRADSENRSEP